MGTAVQRERALIQGIALGQSIELVAKSALCTTNLVEKRISDPAFMEKVRKERTRMTQETGVWLRTWSKHCGKYLFDVVTDPTASPQLRVRAASVLLTEARAWVDADILDRLIELEHAAGLTPET